MSNKNQEILNYLLHYSTTEYQPKFAVMISGPWGCGKSWFAEKILMSELRAAEKKVIYITLYGLTKTSEIDDEIFKELHPVLSDKRMKLAGKVLKGALKTTLNIDIDGDGKADGKIDFQLPEINFPKYLNNSDNYILIFDDIERCKIAIDELLGYLNYFVEHADHKVILIANEFELSKSSEKYAQTKEKLIGKVFLIDSNVGDAIKSFFDEIKNERFEIVKEEYISLFENIYLQSNYRNLRHLRQSVIESNELLAVLDVKHLENDELVKKLLTEFLILTFEVRNGSINKADIGEISKNLTMMKYGSKKDIEIEKFKNFESKYFEFDWGQNLLSDEIWAEIFHNGYFDREKINKYLDEGRFGIEADTPTWRTLWRFNRLSDGELQKILTDVSEKFQKFEYVHIGEIQHVTGMLIALSGMGIYKKSIPIILSIAKKSIRNLKKSGLLKRRSDETGFTQNSGAYGLEFHSLSDERFKEFLGYLNKNIAEAKIATYPSEARNLLDKLPLDVVGFYRDLVINNVSDAEFHSIPILNYIDKKKFVDKICEIEPSGFHALQLCIRERYRGSQSSLENLREESTWLDAVAKSLLHKANQRKGKISGVRLRELSEVMQRASNLLNELPLNVSG